MLFNLIALWCFFFALFFLLTYVGLHIVYAQLPERKEISKYGKRCHWRINTINIFHTIFRFWFYKEHHQITRYNKIIINIVQGSIITVIIYDDGINLKMSYCLFKHLYELLEKFKTTSYIPIGYIHAKKLVVVLLQSRCFLIENLIENKSKSRLEHKTILSLKNGHKFSTDQQGEEMFIF